MLWHSTSTEIRDARFAHFTNLADLGLVMRASDRAALEESTTAPFCVAESFKRHGQVLSAVVDEINQEVADRQDSVNYLLMEIRSLRSKVSTLEAKAAETTATPKRRERLQFDILARRGTAEQAEKALMCVDWSKVKEVGAPLDDRDTLDKFKSYLIDTAVRFEISLDVDEKYSSVRYEICNANPDTDEHDIFEYTIEYYLAGSNRRDKSAGLSGSFEMCII